jgi:hypothetical protein
MKELAIKNENAHYVYIRPAHPTIMRKAILIIIATVILLSIGIGSVVVESQTAVPSLDPTPYLLPNGRIDLSALVDAHAKEKPAKLENDLFLDEQGDLKPDLFEMVEADGTLAKLYVIPYWDGTYDIYAADMTASYYPALDKKLQELNDNPALHSKP